MSSESSPSNAPISSRDFDKLSEVLKGCFADLADRENKHAKRLEKVIVSALKPASTQTDSTTAFWNVYKTVADEYDAEFQDNYKGDLDTSLVFAGLFSTVLAAFIVGIQPGLLPDPNETTQALLRILIHTANSSIFSADQLIIPVWNGPPREIVIVESVLYASLFSTLLAAFLAVLGKQWLAYYSSVGTKGTIAQRGLERQKKFEGFHKWGFEPVMKALPVLLQIALLLFAIAASHYLWTLHHAIASVVISLAVFGVSCYSFFVVSAIVSDSSPFRTPLSDVILFGHGWAIYGIERIWKALSAFILLYLLDLRPTSDVLKAVHTYKPIWPSIGSSNKRDRPLFEGQDDDTSDFVSAVAWVLKTSTDPDVVGISAATITGAYWHPGKDTIASLSRLRDTFMACFQNTPLPILQTSAGRCAIACGNAYYHLFFSVPECSVRFPISFFPDLPQGWWNSCDWPAELQFVYRLLSNVAKVYPEQHNWVLNALQRRNPLWLSSIRHKPKGLAWNRDNTNLEILASEMYFFQFDTEERLGEMEREVLKIEGIDFPALTNWLLCVAICCGVSIHPHDVAHADKSEYWDVILEEIIGRFPTLFNQARMRAANKDRKLFMQTLSILILLIQEFDYSVPSHKYWWKTFYHLMAVSRLSETTPSVCNQISMYVDRKRDGTPFVDPRWKETQAALKRCGLDANFADIPPELVLSESVLDVSTYSSDLFNGEFYDREGTRRIIKELFGEEYGRESTEV